MNNEHIFGPSKIVRYDMFKNTELLDDIILCLPTDVLKLICEYGQMTVSERIRAIISTVGTYTPENSGYIQTQHDTLALRYVHDTSSTIITIILPRVNDFHITIADNIVTFHDENYHAIFDLNKVNVRHHLITHAQSRDWCDFHNILPVCVKMIRLWQCFNC